MIRFLGDRLFARELWIPSRKTVAGGLGLGMAVAMLPPIPVQMIIAAVLATCFRRNVPIACAACWVSNPFTWVPLLYIQGKIGAWTLHWFGKENIEFNWQILKGMVTGEGGFGAMSFAIGVGVAVTGIGLGVLSFLLVHAGWRFMDWFKESRNSAISSNEAVARTGEAEASRDRAEREKNHD
jgi:uncharacterized protein (DUF2062 family)